MTVFWTNDLFCGAGGMGLGFKNAGFRLAGAWDFDKYAVESYGNNVSPKVKQADITQMKWDDLPKANVWTFGFPCQDLSIAGKQAGLFEGKRSGLFFEVMRLLDETIENDSERLPDIIMAENVKGLKPYLEVLKAEYNKRGYRMTYTLYNSKYWGVPQNRERYFVVGIRETIRKAFQFPRQQTDFVPKLSSVLETDVDEKFYIDDEKAAKIIEQAVNGLKVKQATKKGLVVESAILRPERTEYGKQVRKQYEAGEIEEKWANLRELKPRQDAISNTLTSVQKDNLLLESQEVLKDVHAVITPERVDKRQNGRRAKGNEEEMYTLTAQDLHGVIKVVGKLEQPGHDERKRVYDPEGISPTLSASEGGNRQPKIFTVSYNRKDGIEKEIDIANTLTSSDWRGLNQNQSKAAVVELPQHRVRKLTPREYARLQGFPDSYKQVVSNSQFYKQMGNAVTVNVSQAIAEKIKEFLEKNYEVENQ